MGVLGTSFLLQVRGEKQTLVMTEGALSVEPRSQPGRAVTVSAGQTLDLRRDVVDLRPSRPTDSLFWKVSRNLFEDLYPTSSVVLVGGEVTLDGKAFSQNEALLIPPGAVVEAVSSEGAQIRLGRTSVIRLAPGAKIRLSGASVEILAGETFVKHTGGYFPLRLEGAATLLVSRDSVVELARQGDEFLVRIQVGRVLTPGAEQPLKAGSQFAVSGRTVRENVPGPEPKAWEKLRPTADVDDPRLQSDFFGSDTDDADEPAASPEPAPKNGPQSPLQTLMEHEL
jgi:ferric-dicitrate binding protein FerR (iron transport regulator)